MATWKKPLMVSLLLVLTASLAAETTEAYPVPAKLQVEIRFMARYLDTDPAARDHEPLLLNKRYILEIPVKAEENEIWVASVEFQNMIF